MNTRQQELLNLVINNYVATAEPVGSRFLVSKAGLDWSEATVRNELRELEEQGYLKHPHTSAGRLPTLKGYQYYLSTINFSKLQLSKTEGVKLEKSIQISGEYESARKNLAKTVVELSGETVLIAFSRDFVYYTGLSNLFQKPDFADREIMINISDVFDRCEEVIPDFFDEVEDAPKFFLGKEHPFGEMLSVAAMRFGKNGESLMALLGPQRMDYKHNYELMIKSKELV
jgi:heat-inducible transcriptional repressor